MQDNFKPRRPNFICHYTPVIPAAFDTQPKVTNTLLHSHLNPSHWTFKGSAQPTHFAFSLVKRPQHLFSNGSNSRISASGSSNTLRFKRQNDAPEVLLVFSGTAEDFTPAPSQHLQCFIQSASAPGLIYLVLSFYMQQEADTQPTSLRLVITLLVKRVIRWLLSVLGELFL